MSSSSSRTELERLVAALRTDVFAQADDMAYDLSAGGAGAGAGGGGGGFAGVDQLTSAERMAAYSVGVATPSRSIAALSKTEKSVERLYNSMRTTEAGIDDAMKFSSEVHKRALQQKDTELNQLKQLLVAKERTIDSLRDTVESAKRTLEAKLTAITNELAARDGELHEERRRTQDLAYRCQQAELLAQTAVDAAKRNEEAREAEADELQQKLRDLRRDIATIREEYGAQSATLRQEETIRKAIEHEREHERRKFQRELNKLQKKAMAEDALIERVSELEGKLTAEKKSRKANEKWLDAELKTKEALSGAARRGTVQPKSEEERGCTKHAEHGPFGRQSEVAKRTGGCPNRRESCATHCVAMTTLTRCWRREDNSTMDCNIFISSLREFW